MKVILRVLAILIFVSLAGGLIATLSSADNKIISGVNNTHYSTNYQCSQELCFCFQSLLVPYFVFIWFIPVHEFVVYPIFRKYMLQMNSGMKYTTGVFLFALLYFSLLIIEAVGHHFTHFPDKDNMCFLSEKSHHLSLSYWWYCTSGIFQGLGYFYALYGIIEFISSQSPFSMKGLLIGFTFHIWVIYSVNHSVAVACVSHCGELASCSIWLWGVVLLVCDSILSCFHSGVYHCVQKGVQDEKER